MENSFNRASEEHEEKLKNTEVRRQESEFRILKHEQYNFGDVVD